MVSFKINNKTDDKGKYRGKKNKNIRKKIQLKDGVELFCVAEINFI